MQRGKVDRIFTDAKYWIWIFSYWLF